MRKFFELAKKEFLDDEYKTKTEILCYYNNDITFIQYNSQNKHCSLYFHRKIKTEIQKS